MIDSTAVRPAASWSPVVSFRGDGFVHCESDGDYIFELHARDGSFLVQLDSKAQYVADIVIEGAGDAYWQYFSADASTLTPWHGTRTYIEVLIKKEDKYIGYAVVAVGRPEDIWTYSAAIVECKEVQQKDRSYELSKVTLQQMIDAVIQGID